MASIEKNLKFRNAELATAALVLKGALMKMFNTPLTVATKYESKSKGRLVVEYSGPRPDEADLVKVQSLVDDLIDKNPTISICKFDRKEAEAFYSQNLVHGQFIYEKKQPPPSVEQLNIITISDWSICCNASTDYLNSISELNGFKVLRFNYRQSKSELEFCYQVNCEQDNVKSCNKSIESPVMQKEQGNADKVQHGYAKTMVVKEKLLEIFFNSLNMIDSKEMSIENLRRIAGPKMEVVLTSFKNTVYAEAIMKSINAN